MSDAIISILDEQDEIILIENEETSKSQQIVGKRKVLIVDDDEYVHRITKLSLQDFAFQGKSMELMSAYSAKEAKKILNEHKDIALIFVDVVMEEDDSGLKLIKYIREELNNKIIRIILRTGQPGQAPEKNVIVNYDINDYKLKTELTADKLFVSVVSALRAYNDLEMLDLNKKGLEQIIKSSTVIFKEKSLTDFISGVLTQIASIICLDKDAMLIRASGITAKKQNDDFVVQSAIGEYSQYINQNINAIFDQEILASIQNAISQTDCIYTNSSFVYYFKSQLGEESIIYMKSNRSLLELDKELIKIFCTNISIVLDNLYLDKEMSQTQKEIIYTLGEVCEARSKETGNHVKRVAEYSKILALAYGLTKEESELIKLASPMHDIGKLAIPDSILNKPAKLTPEEFEIMKTHSYAGYQMLKNSNGSILKAASIIALQHHEKYNGLGYPNVLKGDEIHIYGRISAIADVFDALGSERVYKKAWPLESILQLFHEEKGKHFDPNLIDIFFQNLDKFITIMNMFKD
jgi:response regulator RpfG family c-di-GMP phosphodiesterase